MINNTEPMEEKFYIVHYLEDIEPKNIKCLTWQATQRKIQGVPNRMKSFCSDDEAREWLKQFSPEKDEELLRKDQYYKNKKENK